MVADFCDDNSQFPDFKDCQPDEHSFVLSNYKPQTSKFKPQRNYCPFVLFLTLFGLWRLPRGLFCGFFASWLMFWAL